MAEEKNKINSLTELLKQRNGFVSIREAIELLGPEEYSSCLVDLVTKDEDDEESATLFFQNGDSATGKPTHVCFSSAFMDWFCDKVDTALEQQGVLSPRTKGVKIV
ncbi:MAG: hypothetical protein A2735_02800 [Candidatus Yanofskybacteria bacterium RIFCSPHIGHO2_01_FULL_41_21]|uniref:Uncharacterized protein n=1 Tax=Candidatus Yanofskybacteria bacterium RIFCSPHIGHO2_01_FULL_41_21 TaxID=1802660 RepID=A0A1F8EAC7_9BACT|nr:MAG: hypothetical protein A2735_02800 [Candidatus Yanofskybacteria bacterium RIFCSPHIGHO2_01_FULL_41_21]